MLRVLIVPAIVAALLLAPRCAGQADDPAEVPHATITLEILKPDLSPRDFPPLPGSAGISTDTEPRFPVPQGDRVVINATVETGDAELAELRVRLDNGMLANEDSESCQVDAHTGTVNCRVEVETGGLKAGHHLVEVWATTKRPDRYTSVTTSFLVVPENDPLLQLLVRAQAGPWHWLEHPAPGIEVTDDERLVCTIRSEDPNVDRELRSDPPSATVTGPVYFRIWGGPNAKWFVYALSRNGMVTYVSGELPIVTLILLQPATPEAIGLEPGDVTLTVWAGDGEVFGPASQATVHIEREEVEP